MLPNGSGMSSLPVYYPWGFGSGYTIEELTLANLTAAIDVGIKTGGALSFTCHAWKLGTAGKLSVADFETFLDYLVTKQTANLIQVLTPTGMCCCRTGTPKNQVYDGTFETCATAAHGWWYLSPGATIETTGGHTGNNFVLIPYDSGGGDLEANIHVEGYRTVLVKFWAKAPTADSKVTISAFELNSPRSFYFSTWSGISTINPTPVAAGTGYTVGDLLTISTGSYASARVMAVDGSGGVTKVCLWTSGALCGTGTKATTGGTGSDCTISVTAVYGAVVQSNTLAVDTTWTQFTFTLGVHDTTNLTIAWYAPGNLDAAICIDDVEIYLL